MSQLSGKYPVEQLPTQRSLGGEKTRADDLELHSSEGIVPLEVTSTPIFNETGNVEYAIATFQDISDRKQVEKTLIENVRLEQEISDRKKAEAELEQAKEAAETANRAKTLASVNICNIGNFSSYTLTVSSRYLFQKSNSIW